MMQKKKIVILGAGPAGLTCAYYLLKNCKDYEVLILEQENQVGGISKTIDFHGYKMDTGIHRFFTKNDEIEKIWEEFLPLQSKAAYDDKLLERKKSFPKIGSDPEKEDKSLLIKDRITRIFYGRKFYDYPVNLNMTTIKNMGFFTIIKVGFSYMKSVIFKKKETSLENFYINRFGKKLYSMFFKDYTEKVWGISPTKISADWGSQRVKGVSITVVFKDILKKFFHLKNHNTETSLIEQFLYPKLGSGQMYEEISKKVEELGGQIILNARVKGLDISSENRVSQIIYELDGKIKKQTVDIAVSSIPIKDLIAGMNTSVPKTIYDIATNLPYREFMSVGLIVDQLKLKNTTGIKTIQNIVPDSWIYIQEPDVRMGRLQIFNNWSPYIFKNKEDMKSKVFLSLEYFASEKDQYWNMSDEKFIEFAIKEAVSIGLIDEDSVESSIRIKVPKAYPAYFGTYSKFDQVIHYLNSFDNLYCIGRNGQHKYNNMDHSMLTGIYAAKNIIENKNDKRDIWNVNTEKEYHEEKTK